MATTIITKNGTTTPVLGNFGAAGELAVNLTTGELWTNDGASVIPVGPSGFASFVPETRNLTAGAGLTGGGDLSADRTFDVGAGTGISVAADTVGLDTANTRNVDHSAVSITAGSGLTGGGTIAVNRTINVGAGTGISVAADTVGLDTANSRNVDHGSVSITAGSGLTGGGTIAASRTINVGAGTGITVAADTVSLNTTYTDGRYVLNTGDTMTGSLFLDIAPTTTALEIKKAPIANNTSHDCIMLRTDNASATAVIGALRGLSSQYTGFTFDVTGANVRTRILNIDSNGVGLGTTADPGHYFRINAPNRPAMYVQRFSGTSGSDVNTQFLSSSAVIANIFNNGLYQQVSDAALKTNMAPLVPGLAALNALSPISYQWKNELGDPEGPSQLGFTAEDIAAQIPEAVADMGDGNNGVFYNMLFPVLVKAIQELTVRVEALEA